MNEMTPEDIAKQEREWVEFETQSLAKGRCPYSGASLFRRQYPDGPREPSGDVLSCAERRAQALHSGPGLRQRRRPRRVARGNGDRVDDCPRDG